MTDYIKSELHNGIGHLLLDRPAALNSLSLDMVRALTRALLAWQDDPAVKAVVVRSTSGKAFCAGGDIRFFYDAARATPETGSPLLEDFFTEEYALNYLVHAYPKPYVAIMDGVVMGGGMGIAQAGPAARLRIVTERTKMAMPEVKIGLFPDVGGGYFLSRAPGETGTWLALTGNTIGAADALYMGLADLFVPADRIDALLQRLADAPGDVHAAARAFAAEFAAQAEPAASFLASVRAAIDRHFAFDDVASIISSLKNDDSTFAQRTLEAMQARSPLMMCVTLAQLRRARALPVADCLRMERTMVRRSFAHRDIVEGVRALVIDKDNAPRWTPAAVADVTPQMIEPFFAPAWPDHAHPLRDLGRPE